MGRGDHGVQQQGPAAVLQALSFFAVLALMVVPFFAVAWYVALPIALAASFLNPAMFLVTRSNMVGTYNVLPALNIAALAGAALFVWRVVALLNRGHGEL